MRFAYGGDPGRDWTKASKHMAGAISSRGLGATSAVRLGGVGGGKGGAAAAIGGLAANIAGTIASELNIAVDPDGRRKPGSAHDLYDVDETASTMVSDLGGSGADRGRVAKALHRFAQELAALMAARPDSRTLEQVQAAIDDAAKAHSGAASVTAVVMMIEQATAAIAGGKN